MLAIVLLAAWVILPIVIWGVVCWLRRRGYAVFGWVLCCASLIGGVVLLAYYVWAVDAQLLAEIDKYEPGTPEADRAADEWASDTDRSFLLLFSPVVTAFWYGFLFLALFGLPWLARETFSLMQPAAAQPAAAQPAAAKTDGQAVALRDDDGNPYQTPLGE